MLACFLVNDGMSPDQAIATVRRARPGSVESTSQELAVSKYADYLANKRNPD